MREISFIAGFLEKPFTSVLAVSGKTRVLVTVSVQNKVPPHVKDGAGWLTSEYALLPASTDTRVDRERFKIGGRTAEIQRLIGRSLRMAVDLSKMPGYTLFVDADVLQADGGTRTTSINGGMLALYLAGEKMVKTGMCAENPVVRWIGAISSGVVGGKTVVDLDYSQDSTADADFNFVFSGEGDIIEVQGTAERAPVTKEVFDSLFAMSRREALNIIKIMKEIGSTYDHCS